MSWLLVSAIAFLGSDLDAAPQRIADEGRYYADPYEYIECGEQFTDSSVRCQVAVADGSQGDDAEVIGVQPAEMFDQVVEDGADADHRYGRRYKQAVGVLADAFVHRAIISSAAVSYRIA